MIGRLLKRWECWRRGGHRWTWRHNYYGDAIYYSGGMRSAWECSHCGHWQCREELGP